MYVDLSPYWERLRILAEQRYEQKDGFSSSRYWNQDSHFLGLCGELLYALATRQKIDTELRITGDGGTDFPGGVDVKTCRFETDAYLKAPVGTKRWPDIFVLCYVDKEQRRGRILGWAWSDDLWATGEIRDFGYGPTYTLHQDRLRALSQLERALEEGRWP